MLELGPTLAAGVGETHAPTLALGLLALALLLLARRPLQALLERLGCRLRTADLICKASPVAGDVLTSLLAWRYSGCRARVWRWWVKCPRGLPVLRLPALSCRAVAGTAGQRAADFHHRLRGVGLRRQDPGGPPAPAYRPGPGTDRPRRRQCGVGVLGGIPVSGGFSRSVVNFDAGAVTPAASMFAALGMAIAALALTPALYYLPKATLGAVIIVAVVGLIDFSHLSRAWRYSARRFVAIFTTTLVTLLQGVETGRSVWRVGLAGPAPL